MYFADCSASVSGELAALGVHELVEQLLLVLDLLLGALYSSTTDFGASGYSVYCVLRNTPDSA